MSRRSDPTVSKYEEMLVVHLRVEKIEHKRQYKFHPKRQWESDFWIVGTNILVEVDGGNWMAKLDKKGNPRAIGRHTQEKDYLKMNEAVMLGFRVFRFLPEQVKSGNAIDTIKRAIKEGL